MTMTTPTLIVLTLVLLALAAHTYRLIRNDRDVYRAGQGARHRRPGIATPWHRRSEPDTFIRSRPRWARITPADDLAASIAIIHPVAQLRALDLTVLEQLAARPLVPSAVAA